MLSATAGGLVYAQGQNGRGIGKPQVGVSYYKVPPGRQDEWLALYKKYHKPIMQYQIDKGFTTPPSCNVRRSSRNFFRTSRTTLRVH